LSTETERSFSVDKDREKGERGSDRRVREGERETVMREGKEWQRVIDEAQKSERAPESTTKLKSGEYFPPPFPSSF